MIERFPYTTARAFDAALTDRFSRQRTKSRHEINELRRQFAYDRLLARLFADRDLAERWILKGGGGLLARIPDQARHSMDLDLYFQGEFNDAIASLQDSGHVDLGDFFDFDITPVRGHRRVESRRLKVDSYIGNKAFEPFRIDLVVTSNMTQPPDAIGPLLPVKVPGLEQSSYRVYSLVDHIADKHAAMLDTYGNGMPSTRYRDLVDLVIIANTQSPAAGPLRAALLSEYAARGLKQPESIELPDESWIDGYASEIESVPTVIQRSAREALATIERLLLPLLQGRATGSWHPELETWGP